MSSSALSVLVKRAVGAAGAASSVWSHPAVLIAQMHTSSPLGAPSREAPAGKHLLLTHPHLSMEEERPKLGSWPNFEPGVNKPTQVAAPEPTWEMLHTKNIITGDDSEATLMSEYDRIKDHQKFGSATGVSEQATR